MKDWKERVTSNRKLAAINASAGSHPAMPFGHRPGGEQAPVGPASQKKIPSLKIQHAGTAGASAQGHPSSQPVVVGRTQPRPPAKASRVC